MDQATECPLCMHDFDEATRVPKVMPCGHTACLHCLKRLTDKLCPMCRERFSSKPSKLPTNFHLLGLVSPMQGSASEPRLTVRSTIAMLRSLGRARPKPTAPPMVPAAPLRSLVEHNDCAPVAKFRHAYAELNTSLLDKDEAIHLVCEGVRRLRLDCGLHNGDWAERVLLAATPTVEEVQLLRPREQHVRLALEAPWLTRLFVESYSAAAGACVRQLPPLPVPRRLATLSVDDGDSTASSSTAAASAMPVALLQPLLRAYAISLETLQLRSSGSHDGASCWTTKTPSVRQWLPACGLRALRELRLLNQLEHRGEVAELQAALPQGVSIQAAGFRLGDDGAGHLYVSKLEF